MRFVLALAIAFTALPARANEEGWFVVLASFRNPDGATFDFSSIRRIRKKVALCGIAPFNDHSAKFEGFAPGYDVHVVGAFPSRSYADVIAQLARPCAPSAYVKFGRYLGE